MLKCTRKKTESQPIISFFLVPFFLVPFFSFFFPSATVSMGFFDDVFISSGPAMPPDTHYDKAENVWVWHYNDTKYFLDSNEVATPSSSLSPSLPLPPSPFPPKIKNK